MIREGSPLVASVALPIWVRDSAMDTDWGLLGARRHELDELDRLLGMLTRPALAGARLPRTLRDELRGMGVRLGTTTRREKLIERLWSRKRPLMRLLGVLDDPLPPCA